MRHSSLILAAALSGALAGAVPAHAQLARESGLLGTEIPGSSPRVAVLPTESAFAMDQLRHERVMDARIRARFNIKRIFHEQGIRYPAAEVFMRIFKRERSLEMWVRPEGETQFSLLKTYVICAMAGELGPKRRQGDNQAPEGFYSVDFFNPQSDYLLSLHLDYPNQRDRAAGLEGTDLGGDIYIHGGCNSEGCLALTDEGIQEVYWLSVEARAAGQSRIPVHIFPARLGDEDLRLLQNAFANEPELPTFWGSLKPGYDYFEEHRRLPAIAVDSRGLYQVNGVSVAAPLGSSTPRRPAPVGVPVGEPVGAPVGEPVGVPATARQPAAVTQPASRPATGGRPAPLPIGAPVGG